MIVKVILAIIIVIVLIIMLPIIVLFIAVIGSAKYEYIFEKDEDGSWKRVPVSHPFGEPIDEDFIKLWNQRNKEYKEDMKRK